MTIAKRVAVALLPWVGKELTAKQIVSITHEAHPDINLTSICPSDYVKYGDYSKGYQFLETTDNGYLVTGTAIKSVKTGRGRGESLDSALASAKALLVSVVTPEVPEVPENKEVTPEISAEDKAEDEDAEIQALLDADKAELVAEQTENQSV